MWIMQKQTTYTAYIHIHMVLTGKPGNPQEQRRAELRAMPETSSYAKEMGSAIEYSNKVVFMRTPTYST